MDLRGQGGERGYAMAALLVSLAVMSVLLSVAMPVWRHQAQREKEAELVFRGEQYARAVALWRSKNQQTFPPSIDVLVQGRYLRKKWKDPITGDDFEVIGAANPNPGAPGGRGGPPQSGTQVAGGIAGVRSKSKDTSIRLYMNQNKYNQWNFVFANIRNRPGGGADVGTPGQPGPGRGGRGGRAGQPGVGTPGGTGFPGPGRGRGDGRGGRGFNPFEPAQPPGPGGRGRGGPGGSANVPGF